jgi:hypothetical protein
MKRPLVFIAFAVLVVLLTAAAIFAGLGLLHQTTVKNHCDFAVLVEVRNEAMGTTETASCPANGMDMIGDLYRGPHAVTVWRTDNGEMFTQKMIMVDEMHHTIAINVNGDVTLQP